MFVYFFDLVEVVGEALLLVVDAHDHFVAVDVDVALNEGNGLGEDVVAGADQIDE